MVPASSGKVDTPQAIAFGVPPSLDELQHQRLLSALSNHLTRRIGVTVVASRALSYEDLSAKLASGVLQAAWLPPALFVELDRSIGLQPVAAAERGSGVGYYCAFFTLVDSDIATLEQIPGHSVGWVDPSSASGYVYPRLQLASYGIDPTTAFQEEVFFRTHSAVVRAVLDRAVDLGATFVHLDPSNPRKVLRAGWRPAPPELDTSAIKWLEPFGPLPSDVIAVRKDVAQSLADKLGEAFINMHEAVEEIQQAARSQFGTGRFVLVHPEAYDVLRASMEAAEGRGLEVSISLRPSLPM
jgi:phosphonate transport system substrate-binding protein